MSAADRWRSVGRRVDAVIGAADVPDGSAGPGTPDAGAAFIPRLDHRRRTGGRGDLPARAVMAVRPGADRPAMSGEIGEP
jgi:hypothetical protein